MVQAGPSAPVASLPVMSEMMRRLDALDSLEAGAPTHPKVSALICWPPDPGSSMLAQARAHNTSSTCVMIVKGHDSPVWLLISGMQH